MADRCKRCDRGPDECRREELWRANWDARYTAGLAEAMNAFLAADVDCAAHAVDWRARAQAERKRADEAERRLGFATKMDVPVGQYTARMWRVPDGESWSWWVLNTDERGRAPTLAAAFAALDAWLAKQKENANG